MNLIVAVSKDWGIGFQGDLLYHLMEDMKYFRRETLGKTVVMGRKTLESLPGGKPLPKRDTVVLTRNREMFVPGVKIVHDVDELLAYTEPITDDVFVCGGAEIYRELLPYCRLAYITEIDGVKPADTYFPNLDELPEWSRISESDPIEEDGLTYRFCIWENANLK